MSAEVVHYGAPICEDWWKHHEGVGVQQQVQHIPPPSPHRVLVPGKGRQQL